VRLKKTAGRFGLASLGAIAGTVILAGTAIAGPPHTVSVNGVSTSGNSSFTAATKSPGVGFVVNNSAGDVTMGCTSATATGNVHRGSVGLPPGLIATISGTTWTGCVSVGLDMTVTQSASWGIYMDAQTTNAAQTDTVTGRIRAVSGTTMASVKDVLTNGALCSFDVVYSGNGAVGNFTESNQRLNVTEAAGNLKVANVSGCLGDIANNDTADFTATYNVTTTGTGINVF